MATLTGLVKVSTVFMHYSLAVGLYFTPVVIIHGMITP